MQIPDSESVFIKVMFVFKEVHKLKILGISISALKKKKLYGLQKVNVLQMPFSIV